MIKRLNLFSNAAQNQLTLAMIDKSHQKIKYGHARRIYQNLGNEKYLSNLLSALKKNLKSSSNTLKIKTLIMIHYFIRKTMFTNSKLLEFAQHQLNQLKNNKKSQLNSTKSKIVVQNQQKQYIQKNIIEFYILYLLKFIVHQESYTEAKITTEAMNGGLDMVLEQKYYQTLQTTAQTKVSSKINKYSKSLQDSPLMSHINHGFEIINLINFILQSQQSFNKMGRYYLEQQQILNLFIMYLDDMTIYNDYIKKLAKILTKKVNLLKEEQIKHCFLYLTQSQKTSDKLYQFYFNRYYYAKVKKLITMPTFLSIQNDDFERVVKEIKRVDKQLFLTVKQSKYSEQYKMNKTMNLVTQPNLGSHSSKNRSIGKMNQTMMTEVGHSKKLANLNQTLQSLKAESKTNEEIHQNITKYIECLDDIDEQDFI